jgi:hypothetical protein
MMHFANREEFQRRKQETQSSQDDNKTADEAIQNDNLGLDDIGRLIHQIIVGMLFRIIFLANLYSSTSIRRTYVCTETPHLRNSYIMPDISDIYEI